MASAYLLRIKSFGTTCHDQVRRKPDNDAYRTYIIDKLKAKTFKIVYLYYTMGYGIAINKNARNPCKAFAIFFFHLPSNKIIYIYIIIIIKTTKRFEFARYTKARKMKK